MGPYGSLPTTGIGVVVIGGTAVSRPVLALTAAAAVIAVGVVLRFAGRRKPITTQA